MCKMKPLIVVLSCALCVSFYKAQACTPPSPNSLKAHYAITTTTGKGTKTQEFILWRHHQQVAIEYPHLKVIEFWETTPMGLLRLVRYFTTYQRGIEYHPTELNQGRGFSNWSKKYQLISEQALKSFTLNHEKITNCQTEQYFNNKDPLTPQKLTWIKELKLPKSLRIQQSVFQKTLTLKVLSTEKKPVAQFFKQLLKMRTTDYTDVGDNEYDPFLQTMINMGFIEHAQSGFYDANGNSLSLPFGHRH